MRRINVFISSVQSEFADERQALSEYLTRDALLGKFFKPFIFEELPAINRSATSVYIDQVGQCEIYLGLFGTSYGHEDSSISKQLSMLLWSGIWKKRNTSGPDCLMQL